MYKKVLGYRTGVWTTAVFVLLVSGISRSLAQQYSITVTLTDSATAQPVSDARVLVLHGIKSGSGGGMGIEWEQVAMLHEGTGGVYRFDSLDASVDENDLYQVLIYHDSYNTVKSANLVLDKNLTEEYALTPLGYATLVVCASDSNAPLSGVQIVAGLQVNSGATYVGYTGAGGMITFPQVIAGDYRVTGALAGYRTASGGITLATGGSDTVRLVMPPVTGAVKTVNGTITNPDGQPVAGALVLVKFDSKTDRVTLVDSTDLAGAFSVTGIDMHYEEAKVEVEAEGYTAPDTSVVISDTVTTVDLVIEPITGIFPGFADAGVETPAAFRCQCTGGVLEVRAAEELLPVTLRVYSVTGKQVYSLCIRDEHTVYRLPVRLD